MSNLILQSLLCYRSSGASEKDQRLRLCPLHSERRRNQCHEHPQWKGQQLQCQKVYKFIYSPVFGFVIKMKQTYEDLVIFLSSSLQVVDGSPIEVTLAKPVDKDSYVRYTRGTGGRGGSLLQTDYTAYTLGQVRPQTHHQL